MSPDCWLALVLIGVVGLVISNDASAACYQQGPANSTILNANCKDMVVVSVKQQPLKMTFSSTATGHDTIDQPFELLLGACTVLLTFAFTSGGPLVYLGADTMAMPVEATVDNQGITFLYLGNQLTASCGTSPVFAGDPNGKQTVTIGIKPKSITPKGLEKLKLTIYSPVLSVEKDDDMDIKTTIAIIAGCVCVVLCFSSSVGSSSYGSVYCYRKHKKRKELKKQKTTKQLPPTSNIPPTPNNNQGYTYSSNMEVPRASLLPQKYRVTNGLKKPIPKCTNAIPWHKVDQNNEKKVEKPAEPAHELHTARALEPTTPKLSTPQLATAQPSNTNQQSPATKQAPQLAVLGEKKADEAINKNKLKDTDYYVYGDDSKDENEKKGDKKGDKKDEKKEEKKESKDELKVEPTQDDKA